MRDEFPEPRDKRTTEATSIRKDRVSHTFLTPEMGGHTSGVKRQASSVKCQVSSVKCQASMRDKFSETTDKRTNEATLIHEDRVSHTFLTLEMGGHTSSVDERSEEMSLLGLQIREPMEQP